MNKHPDFITDYWDKLPEINRPEIALVGRSNVGKSSFINALIGRVRARTSQTPGKTQTINVYDEQSYLLVDLPGFGYAKTSKTNRFKWQKMCESYLLQRENLIGVFHLVDIRHAWQNVDIDLAGLIGMCDVQCQMILTKSDKLSKNNIQKQASYYQKSLSGFYKDPAPLITTSAKDKTGIQASQLLIRQWLDNETAE